MPLIAFIDYAVLSPFDDPVQDFYLFHVSWGWTESASEFRLEPSFDRVPEPVQFGFVPEYGEVVAMDDTSQVLFGIIEDAWR